MKRPKRPWGRDVTKPRISRAQKAKWAKAMRKNPTKHEAILGRVLLSGATGVTFVAQRVLHGYIADFYAPSARLLVEVDGTSHTSPQGRLKDALRDHTMTSHGCRTLRFSNAEVERALPTVLEAITKVANERVALFSL